MQNMETIVRLEELEREFQEGTIVWDCDGKKSRSWNLWNTHGRVAVARTVIPADSVFPIHVHNEVEVLICFAGEGVVVVTHPDKSEIVIPFSAGKSVRLEKGTPHRLEAFTDVWLIAVSVPASPGFPE